MPTSDTWGAELARASVQCVPPDANKAIAAPLIVCLQRPVPPLLERAFRHLAGLFLLASVLVLWLSWEAYETSMTLKALVPDVSVSEFDRLVIIVPEHLTTRLVKRQHSDPFPLVLGIGALVCGLLGWLGVRQALHQKQMVFDELPVTCEEPSHKPGAVGVSQPHD